MKTCTQHAPEEQMRKSESERRERETVGEGDRGKERAVYREIAFGCDAGILFVFVFLVR